MRRLRWPAAVLLALWLSVYADRAQAQFQYVRPQTNPYNTPILSPYLNLNRGGLPAINYFGLVRPQVETQQSLQTLGQQQQILQQQLLSTTEMGRPTEGASGHPTYFMNYSHYFPQMGRTVTGGTSQTLTPRR